MKIDNPLLAQVTTGALQQSGGVTEARPSGAAAGSAPSDRVQLSNLSAALRDLNTEDPDRSAQVSQIAKLVESGNYSVDAASLASKIVGESTSLS